MSTYCHHHQIEFFIFFSRCFEETIGEKKKRKEKRETVSRTRECVFFFFFRNRFTYAARVEKTRENVLRTHRMKQQTYDTVSPSHPDTKRRNRQVGRGYGRKRRSAQMDMTVLREILERQSPPVQGLVKSKRLIDDRFLRRESMLPLENLKMMAIKTSSETKKSGLQHVLAAQRVLEKPRLQRFDSADYYLAKSMKRSLQDFLIIDRTPSPTKESNMR